MYVCFSGDVPADKVHYCERFLELMIDLTAQLPTRRFFNLVMDDAHVVVKAKLSSLVHREDGKLFVQVRHTKLQTNSHSYPYGSGLLNQRGFQFMIFLFYLVLQQLVWGIIFFLFYLVLFPRQLLEVLKFYAGFEINEQTGEALTDSEMINKHYNRITSLQVKTLYNSDILFKKNPTDWWWRLKFHRKHFPKLRTLWWQLELALYRNTCTNTYTFSIVNSYDEKKSNERPARKQPLTVIYLCFCYRKRASNISVVSWKSLLLLMWLTLTKGNLLWNISHIYRK